MTYTKAAQANICTAAALWAIMMYGNMAKAHRTREANTCYVALVIANLYNPAIPANAKQEMLEQMFRIAES